MSYYMTHEQIENIFRINGIFEEYKNCSFHPYEYSMKNNKIVYDNADSSVYEVRYYNELNKRNYFLYIHVPWYLTIMDKDEYFKGVRNDIDKFLIDIKKENIDKI